MRTAAALALFLFGGCRLFSSTSAAPHRSDSRMEAAVAVRYPVMMLSANVSGAARVRLALDSARRPIPGSIRVLVRSHELFGQALMLGVRRWSFAAIDRAEMTDEADSVTVDARFDIRDGEDCPHPARCSTADVLILPPKERVERIARGQISILLVSCPTPVRARCLS